MANEKIWLSSPTMHGDELKYMTEAFETNWMSTIGENIDDVESRICKAIGCKYAVALGTGTSALHLAVKLTNLKRNERVLCSDMTFSATVNPVVYEGGIPVFVDSEYETWNMDPVALEKAFKIYPNARVVIIAHLYGTPAKLDEIVKICKEHNAILIEDAAESLGSTYKGKATGSFGTYNCISFNGNKIITGSTGGMLLTDDKEAAEKARKWSTQARDKAPWYQHTELGYNYRMSNVIAGVVRGQLPYLKEHISQKKAIYKRYKEAFKNLPLKMNPYDEVNSAPNHWLSCIIIDKDAMCEQIRTDLDYSYKSKKGKTCPQEIFDELAKANIESRPIWKPMHMQPIFNRNVFVTVNSKFADEDIFARGLCLPSDNKMTPEQQDRVIEVIKHCFE